MNDRCATGGDLVCASYLGAAVRSFFARGGRRAMIVRVGDPWPYLVADRAAQQPAAHSRAGAVLR